MLYLRLQALNLCLQHGFLACQGLHPLDPWGLHPNTHYIVNPSTHYIVNPSTHYIVNPSTHYIFNSSTHHIVNPNIFMCIYTFASNIFPFSHIFQWTFLLELGTYQWVSIKWIWTEQGDSQYEYIMY